MQPDKSFETFAVSNGYSLVYHADKEHLPTDHDNQTIVETCRFIVDEPALVWMLNGDHTQNEVLARQHECPHNLTLAEYKNFGTLRADGHRLQLRKLYAFIATEGLSFESKSVQALIMQTLWQLGPGKIVEFGKIAPVSESHEDFTDSAFVLEMCKLIDQFIEGQRANWKHPLKLMMAAVLAVRMFEMNEDEIVADEIVKLLQKLRDIAW